MSSWVAIESQDTREGNDTMTTSNVARATASGIGRRSLLAGASLGCLATPFIRPARAADTVQMLSHRFPALEYLAEKMRGAIPGVEVNTQLMPFDKALELATIAFSSKASSPDIVYGNDSTFLTFAKNGWIRPLDDLWAKYKDEFALDDFTKTAIAERTYQGHIWGVPATSNTLLFFYRKDLFAQAGKQPPKTIVEYRDLAKSFNSPLRAGTISCLRPVDAGLNETNYYMDALGDGWFDDKWRPIFNNAKGVAAIEMLAEITKYAQQGFTNAANDECMITLQQDAAAMGIQWATRAMAMDDPNKSRVVDKIDWAVPPQGHQTIGGDGYSISAFSKQDPELLFRILATATSKQNLRGAAGMMVPTRTSVMEDTDLKQKYRFFPAALAAMQVGQSYPKLPEFYSVGQFITQRINQAMTGQMTVKGALDAAAGETESFLKGHGYYQ
jgi:multiple sugar transport system substrate-binding protein